MSFFSTRLHGTLQAAFADARRRVSFLFARLVTDRNLSAQAVKARRMSLSGDRHQHKRATEIPLRSEKLV